MSTPIQSALALHRKREYQTLELLLANHKVDVALSLNHGLPAHVLSQIQCKELLVLAEEFSSSMGGQGVICDLEEFPIIADSVDLIVSYHSFDQENYQLHGIAESWRCLSPNGVFILLGWNSRYPFHLPKTEKDVSAPLLSFNHLLRLLRTQGFSIDYSTTIGFQPFWNPQRWGFILKFLDTLGALCWPNMGASYIVVARKATLGMTHQPLNNVKSWFRRWPKPVVQPTTREKS